MTISEDRRLRISIITLGLFAVGAMSADRVLAQGAYSCLSASACVPMTLNASLALTNLHPAVTHVQLACTGTMPSGTVNGQSPQTPVVSRGYTGNVTATLNIPQYIVSTAATHAINVSCTLQLVKPGGGPFGPDVADAVATATGPVGLLDSNWNVVATGSTVKWTQAVTFPNASAAP